jgi:hypothetical protein
MTLPANAERDIGQACQLMQEYSFDLGGYGASELTHLWQQHLQAEPSWIRAAVVEALYQGRYKAFSVEQILRLWKRRGYSMRHFNHDFERVVLGPMEPMLAPYRPPTAVIPEDTEVDQAPAAPRSTAEVVLSGAAAPEASDPSAASRDDTPLDSDNGPAGAEPNEPLPEHLSKETLDQDPERPTPTEIAAEPSAGPLGSAQAEAHDTAFISSMDGLSALGQDDPFSQPAPIQTFEPMQMGSGFYQRLEAIARQSPY